MDIVLDQFEASRGRLHAIAYRMLGSHAEADDAVQDVWLRVERADTDSVDNVGGWLTTVLSRICLDRLRTRQSRGEQPADLAAPPADTGRGPEDEAVLADNVGTALLVVLDSLAPAERVAFVLHDVFAVPFDRVAEILDRSPEAARQLASRARRRVHGAPTTTGPDPALQQSLVEAFLRAARTGDFAGLLAVLDPDVELRPDAAALAAGALAPMAGAEAVAAALSGGAKAARLATIDGLAGFVWAPGGQVRAAVLFTLSSGRIGALEAVADPERLAAMEIVLAE